MTCAGCGAQSLPGESWVVHEPHCQGAGKDDLPLPFKVWTHRELKRRERVRQERTR
jgi:hypothetical protein